jgi:succinate dehydrogenase/fumarate reductase flavoprotein subunit
MRDVQSDVVVLGSGAAGLSAALTAAVGGARVTVLEATPLFGGTTAVSGGGMWLPGNTLDPDYRDSLDDARVYLRRLTLGYTPEAVIDRYLAVSGSVPDFFAANSPLTFSADIGRPDYHAPWEGSSLTSRTVFPTPYELPRLGELEPKVRRPGPGGILPIQHSEELRFLRAGNADGINDLIRERLAKKVALRGLALVGGLMEGCVRHGVTLVAGARGRQLIVENGRVVGLQAQQNGGHTEYRARLGVVLGSGGFEWNRELWDAFVAVPWDGPATPPVNHGDGLMMASSIGAKLANLDKVTWCQSCYAGETYDGQPYVRSGVCGGYPGEILVNRRGKRFANELLNYNDIGRLFTHFDPHTYEYDNHPAFAIGDRRTRDRVARHMTPSPTATAQGDGWVEGGTLREVAERLGIDPDGLEAQVGEFNADAAHGTDPVFHRAEAPWEQHVLEVASGVSSGYRDRLHESIVPIVDPPFVGHRVRAGLFGTRGGPVIDEEARILGWDERPIPGLFGAGNVTAHPFRWAYPGGGGTLGPAVTFGHIAGRGIVEAGGRT